MATPDQRTASGSARIHAIDWLRGLAVVLMILAHGFDAWLAPTAQSGTAYTLIRHLSGLPSRLFLLLVGASLAIRFEQQIRRGETAGTMRRLAAKRGLQILALAYLFRLQEHLLGGLRGPWEDLFRVDILNGIGASMLVVALVAVPRAGRPRIGLVLGAAAFFVLLGPVIGPARFPEWLPRPLTSYLGGQRPMAWFSLFPWAGWTLVGVALGHLWVRESHDPRRAARCFLLGGAAGLALTGAALLVDHLWPNLIPYPSVLAKNLGPLAFLQRLGVLAALAALAWVATRSESDRFSPMRQLGRTSLLIYWVHVDLCYGGLARPIRQRLDIPQAAVGIALLTLLMLGLSVAKTRYGASAAKWLRVKAGSLRAGLRPGR